MLVVTEHHTDVSVVRTSASPCWGYLGDARGEHAFVSEELGSLC